MKLTKTGVQELVRRVEGGGLFSVDFKYKVSEAEGDLNYTGPKLPAEMWRQILSFFKWTQDTTQSESQIRLFVSAKLGTWKAWAFPQEAQTGLSTKELETDGAKAQRAALFENDADWVSWGTVHHHCTISAFQSGTDEADEKKQGGLHMTVGDMDKAVHSLHCRLYHQGDLYEPDMSKFWDIGDMLSGLPSEIVSLLPSNIEDVLARRQMCHPSSVEFPNQWKLNLIKRERASLSLAAWNDEYQGGMVYDSDTNTYKTQDEKDGQVQWMDGHKYVRRQGVWIREETAQKNGRGNKRRRGKINLDPVGVRASDALNELLDSLHPYNVDEEGAEIILQTFTNDNEASVLLQVCKDNDVLPEDMIDELRRRQAIMDMTKGGMD